MSGMLKTMNMLQDAYFDDSRSLDTDEMSDTNTYLLYLVPE
jgi:hypothetical protein